MHNSRRFIFSILLLSVSALTLAAQPAVNAAPSVKSIVRMDDCVPNGLTSTSCTVRRQLFISAAPDSQPIAYLVVLSRVSRANPANAISDMLIVPRADVYTSATDGWSGFATIVTLPDSGSDWQINAIVFPLLFNPAAGNTSVAVQ